MRIELIAPPFSGHLHPLLAIARQLACAHQVCVLSTPSVQGAIRACGLPAEAILTPQDEQLLWAIANPPHAVKANPLRMHHQLQQALRLMLRLRALLEHRWARQRPDLVIADFTLPPAGLLALERGIPWWTSLPSPCVLETPDGPPAYLGGLMPARHRASLALHGAARWLTRAFKQAMHRGFRRHMRALGLPSLYRADGTEAVYSPQCILALGVQALEFERSWPEALRFVGPMLCTPPSDHPAPPFQPGKRHILVTAGTHLDWAKQRLFDAARALAQRHPDWVVHVSDGHAQAPSAAAEQELANLQRLPFVDYERHLLRYDLVLHHGGAGVMYHAIKAGIPALVHPLDYDQFDHAARLQAHGAGLWLKRLDQLPEAFARALAEPALFQGLPRLQQAVLRAEQALCVQDLVAEWARTGHLPAAR